MWEGLGYLGLIAAVGYLIRVFAKAAVAMKDISHILRLVQLLLLTCESKEDSGLAQQWVQGLRKLT